MCLPTGGNIGECVSNLELVHSARTACAQLSKPRRCAKPNGRPKNVPRQISQTRRDCRARGATRGRARVAGPASGLRFSVTADKTLIRQPATKIFLHEDLPEFPNFSRFPVSSAFQARGRGKKNGSSSNFQGHRDSAMSADYLGWRSAQCHFVRRSLWIFIARFGRLLLSPSLCTGASTIYRPGHAGLPTANGVDTHL